MSEVRYYIDYNNNDGNWGSVVLSKNAKNSDFLIPVYLQADDVDLRFQNYIFC